MAKKSKSPDADPTLDFIGQMRRSLKIVNQKLAVLASAIEDRQTREEVARVKLIGAQLQAAKAMAECGSSCKAIAVELDLPVELVQKWLRRKS